MEKKREAMDKVDQELSNDEADVEGSGQLPVDRGWAWVILAASWMNQFLVNGQYRTFGILFPEIQRKFDASAATTSLISALNLIAFGVSTMLVQTVGLQYFSTRQVVMLGSVTMCMSYAFSAFSHVVELLMLFQGIFNGLATGLVFAPTSCLLGEYFHKRRGMAICLSYTGAGLGLFAFSFLAIICLDEYGFTGAMLMVGAACFHSLIAGALLRPMSYYSRHINQHKVKTLCNANHNYCHRKNGTVSKKDISEKLSSPLLRKQFTQPSTQTSKRTSTYSQNSQGSITLKLSSTIDERDFWPYSSSDLGSSMVEINSFSNEKTETADDLTGKNQWCKKIKSSILTFTSIDIIKRPVFIGVLFCGCSLAVGCDLSLVYLAPHAMDLGLSNKQASILLTVISITDIVSMPVWGLIADKHWLDSKILAALAAMGIGTTTLFMPLYTHFNTMMFFSLMFGLFGRVWFSLLTIVMVDMFGLRNMKSALGIFVPVQTVSNSCFVYIVGTMRDRLGSYNPGFQLMAAFLIAGAVGFLAIRLIETCGKTGGTQSNIGKEVEP